MNFWLLMSTVAVLDVLGISLGKFYVISQKSMAFWSRGFELYDYGGTAGDNSPL